jgi:hypothetical protein
MKRQARRGREDHMRDDDQNTAHVPKMRGERTSEMLTSEITREDGSRKTRGERGTAHTVVEEDAGLGEVGVALDESVDACNASHVASASKRK